MEALEAEKGALEENLTRARILMRTMQAELQRIHQEYGVASTTLQELAEGLRESGLTAAPQGFAQAPLGPGAGVSGQGEDPAGGGLRPGAGGGPGSQGYGAAGGSGSGVSEPAWDVAGGRRVAEGASQQGQWRAGSVVGPGSVSGSTSATPAPQAGGAGAGRAGSRGPSGDGSWGSLGGARRGQPGI